MVLAHDLSEGQRTCDIQISVDVTFDSMLLSEATLCGLEQSGFHKPSPIQLHGIPLGKCGFDLFLEAKSGTGKTAVFTIIALENLDLDKGLQVVILAPTREIAAQISDVMKQIGSSYVGLNVEVVMGGLPLEEDIAKLQRNIHILVGSPGRMRHLIQNKHVQVSAVRLFVLDEADKLMDKSFQADINYIFSSLPKEKQVIMSSATYPQTLNDVMQNYVQRAQRICPDSNSILLGIKQLVTIVPSHVNIVRQTDYKFKELLKILSKQEFKQCLIFCNYQGRVVELCTMLMREKWPAEQLHSQLEQNDRLDALKMLQNYKCRILVSTDLAARGIDASNVDLVINFEAPTTWPTYLHRIGRAGRFGSYGIAITILSKGGIKKFKEIIRGINASINLQCLWADHAFESCKSDTCHETSGEQIKATGTFETSDVSETYETSEFDKSNVMLQMSDDDQAKVNCKNLVELTELKKEETNTSLFDYPHKVRDRKVEYRKVESHEISEGSDDDQDLNIGVELIDLSKYKMEKPITSLLNPVQQFKEHKVESFNDLMASFECHDPNNNHDKDVIQDVKTDDNTVLNQIPELTIVDSNGDTDFVVKQTGEDKINSSVHKFTSHKYVEKEISKNSLENHIKHNDFAQKNLITALIDRESANLNTNSSQALRNAGLPTSFGSTKCSNQVNKLGQCKFNKTVNDKDKANNIKQKSANNRNKYKQPRYKIRSLEANHCDDGFSIESCLPRNSAKYRLPQNKDSSRVSVLNCSSEIDYNNEDVQYQNYACWYKNLKTHIRQVEMALYNDELLNK